MTSGVDLAYRSEFVMDQEFLIDFAIEFFTVSKKLSEMVIRWGFKVHGGFEMHNVWIKIAKDVKFSKIINS